MDATNAFAQLVGNGAKLITSEFVAQNMSELPKGAGIVMHSVSTGLFNSLQPCYEVTRAALTPQGEAAVAFLGLIALVYATQKISQYVGFSDVSKTAIVGMYLAGGLAGNIANNIFQGVVNSYVK